MKKLNQSLFKKIFRKEKPIIAMLHVFDGEKQQQIVQALQDLEKLHPLVDGVIVENYDCGHFDTNVATEEIAKVLLEITEAAMNAKVLADAVVVTGEYTGEAARIEDLRIVKQMIEEHPLIIGSGLSAENAETQLSIADGAIVGTAFKKRGVRQNEPVDKGLVKRMMNEVEKLR